MATLARQIKRLEQELAALRESHKQEKAALETQVTVMRTHLTSEEGHVRAMKQEIAMERLKRVSAQRGLVAYMREAGLGDRIGYDPDQDPVVMKEVAEGQLPPPLIRPTVREIRRQDERRTTASVDRAREIPNAGKPIPRERKPSKPRNAKARKRAQPNERKK